MLQIVKHVTMVLAPYDTVTNCIKSRFLGHTNRLKLVGKLMEGVCTHRSWLEQRVLRQ